MLGSSPSTSPGTVVTPTTVASVALIPVTLATIGTVEEIPKLTNETKSFTFKLLGNVGLAQVIVATPALTPVMFAGSLKAESVD